MAVKLNIELDPGRQSDPALGEHYAPGDEVSGQILATADDLTNCRKLTVSVGWHTEGRGDKDSEILYEATLHEGTIDIGEQRFPFSVRMPEGPLSYAGHYINVVWHIKARLDLAWRFDPKAERTFYLSLP